MSEYIKRQDAYDAVLFAMCGTGYQSDATWAIDCVPAADVAPVVRCKDCEHWGTRKADGYGFCCIWGTSVEGNAFCSSGVKRRTRNE